MCEKASNDQAQILGLKYRRLECYKTFHKANKPYQRPSELRDAQKDEIRRLAKENIEKELVRMGN